MTANGETLEFDYESLDLHEFNIVTIDRSGMSIAGDLKLSGYPKETTIQYAASSSSITAPSTTAPNT